MQFTRVVYAENTFNLEQEMNEIISKETNNGSSLKDIKFSTVFQSGTFGTEKISNTAILIFEEE